MESLLGRESLVALAALVFVSTALLAEAVFLFWSARRNPRVQKLKSRLQTLGQEQPPKQATPGLKFRTEIDRSLLSRLLNGFAAIGRLQKYIAEAGLNWSAPTVILVCTLLGVLAFLTTREGLHLALVVAVLATALAAGAPLVYLFVLRNRRLRTIERQLPEALDLMVRALKAGHAFSSALQMAGDELPHPIAGELRLVHDEISYGVSLPLALVNLSVRLPITDLRFFVVAVIVQRESGGNLTEILSNLSRLVRERLKFYSKVKVLTAEARLSAWILGIMPFALAGIMHLLNPKFIAPLFSDPIGQSMVQVLLVLMVVGGLMLRSIVKIRV